MAGSRMVLAAELGIEPGPALRDIEQAILTHDRRLLSTVASPDDSANSGSSVALAGVGNVAALPSGLVTFLFTDLEDSTRLLQRLGTPYGCLLERYRTIMRAAVTEAGGVEVNTLGAGLLGAFPTPSSAIAVAAVGQRALRGEVWSADASIRVRMGIASGEAVPAGGDYAAEAVNLVARHL